MIANVLLGLGAMVVCLAIQAFLVVVAIQVYVNHRRLAASPTLVGTFVLICGVMLVLVIGNFLQIALWRACLCISASSLISTLRHTIQP